MKSDFKGGFYMKDMKMVEQVMFGVTHGLYWGNEDTTQQLMELFDKISRVELKTADDYIKMYYENFYTYATWDELVKSEKDNTDGLTEEECKEQLNETIWQLPCGWYVQYV